MHKKQPKAEFRIALMDVDQFLSSAREKKNSIRVISSLEGNIINGLCTPANEGRSEQQITLLWT
jgi:hypothetical protein